MALTFAGCYFNQDPGRRAGGAVGAAGRVSRAGGGRKLGVILLCILRACNWNAWAGNSGRRPAGENRGPAAGLGGLA